MAMTDPRYGAVPVQSSSATTGNSAVIPGPSTGSPGGAVGILGPGRRAPLTGGAEVRGVDTLGKKLGLGIFSVILPPAAVAMKTGDAFETGLNLGLVFLGYFPAVIHSLIVSYSSRRASCVPCGTIIDGPPQAVDARVTYPLRRTSAMTTGDIPPLASSSTSSTGGGGGLLGAGGLPGMERRGPTAGAAGAGPAAGTRTGPGYQIAAA